VTPAFYHWQTKLELNDIEETYLDSLQVKKLYVKFFDVDQSDTSDKTKALAQLETEQFEKKTRTIIPAIFITNRTFFNLNEKDLEILSQRIFDKIVELRNSFDKSPLTEIQIDCDWSPQTRTSYFTLLKLLKKQLGSAVTLSVTIRLHQIKFPETTGIPPVDRGMLMFYNMGEVDNFNTQNSIIDLEIANRYLSKFGDYPLPLDVALPIFGWGVLFRDQKMIKLINNLAEIDLSDTSRFYKASENRYKVTKSTYLQGYYLYAGDVIRLEDSPIQEVQAAAALLNKLSDEKDLTVSLYHLDTKTLSNYSYDQLQSIYDQFRNL